MVTPINVGCLKQLLKEPGYDAAKSKYLVNGFSEGFDFGYQGPIQRCDSSENLPMNPGDEFNVWEKMMKETKAGRYAGPYDTIPYYYYVQSPIGLVPKDVNKTSVGLLSLFLPYCQRRVLGSRSLLVVYIFTSTKSPRGPPWNEGHRPKVRHETSVFEVPVQEQHKHSFFSSSTSTFITGSLYTVRRYRTSPGAPDLRARLG